MLEVMLNSGVLIIIVVLTLGRRIGVIGEWMLAVLNTRYGIDQSLYLS